VTRLDSEYATIIHASGYGSKRLTKGRQKRLDELSQEIKGQTEPPRPLDVESLYQKYKIDLATDWLKVNISVDCANDFNRTLLDAQKRFAVLDFKACQIINGDVGKETTIWVRYAIQRLIDRHYELLHEKFPDHESHPERDELPDELRAFEVEILDEYTAVEQQIRGAAEYLKRLSTLVRSKLPDPWEGPESPSQWAKRFDVSDRTFSRMRANEVFRIRPGSTTRRLWIHRDDVRRLEKK
jgi:hypothetical protein